MPSDIGAGAQGSVGTGALANIKNPADAISSMIGSIGTFVKDLSSAGLNKSQSNEISSLLAQKLRGLYLDNENKEFTNKILEVDAFIKENIKDAEVGKAWDEWVKLGADIMYTGQLTDTAKQQEFFYKYESLLSKAKEKLTSQQYLQLCATFDSVIELYRQQINTEKARQTQLYASSYEQTEAARLHISQQHLTDMESDLTSLKSVFQKLDNAIKKNDVKISNIGLDQKELENLIYQVEQSHRLSDIKDDWNLWNKVRRVQNMLGIGVTVGIHN